MNAGDEKPGSELCSARHSLRPIHFYCRAPQARSVELAGDFNHWNPLPMQRRDDGWWSIEVMPNEYKMMDSQQLLAEYAANGSESAFRELVGCYINLVYSTALRLVDGDTALAQDVTQTVFISLARKGRTLSGAVMLGGCLQTVSPG